MSAGRPRTRRRPAPPPASPARVTTVAVRADYPDRALNPDHEAAAHASIVDAEAGVVEVTPRRKRVALVGFATSTRGMAPFDNAEYEIWALNQLYRHTPRADRWFEMHRRDVFLADTVRNTDYLGWLQKAPIPVYMLQTHPDIPMSVRYPIERVMEECGDYYYSTPAYMMALAILEGFEEIAIFGIDLIVGTEYAYQKPSMEYLVGYALGKGIRVEIPSASALLKATYRYGYDPEPYLGVIGIENLDDREKDLLQQKERAEILMSTVDGALQEVQYWKRVLTLVKNGGTLKIPGGIAALPKRSGA